MAIAGKVAITPKGEWNAQTAYTKLDLVFYDNASYVAIQPSTGVEPTNESYWMLMVQSAGGADLDGIIDGSIQVGNAKTLDGHGAEYFAPKADLANYLPLTGGRIKGSIDVKSDKAEQVYASVSNAVRNVYQTVLADGTYKMIDATNSAYLISSTPNATTTFHGTASGNLPLSGGGTVSGAKSTLLTLENTSSVGCYQEFRGNNGKNGSLGFMGVDTPVMLTASGSVKDILHTGNKPTGTYTGNGDATQRRIETGGTGEFALIKYGNTGFALLTSGGYIGFNGTAVIHGSDAYFASSKIILSTTNVIFNESGSTYKWQVL